METVLSKIKEKSKRFRIKEVYGDCLQAVGVKSYNSLAIIDGFTTPKIGDIVHCAPPGVNISSYLKQIKDIKDGVYIVGTAYLDSSRDYTFEAGEIYGVVIETYGKISGYREYVRPTHLRKKRLKGANNEQRETD